eukprot:scaffold21339_cov58-Phaeocystis_antarctica.AAC.3
MRLPANQPIAAPRPPVKYAALLRTHQRDAPLEQRRRRVPIGDGERRLQRRERLPPRHAPVRPHERREAREDLEGLRVEAFHRGLALAQLVGRPMQLHLEQPRRPRLQQRIEARPHTAQVLKQEGRLGERLPAEELVAAYRPPAVHGTALRARLVQELGHQRSCLRPVLDHEGGLQSQEGVLPRRRAVDDIHAGGACGGRHRREASARREHRVRDDGERVRGVILNLH